MRKTTIYLSEAEAAALRRLSEATGKSRASLVREALRHLLGQAPPRRFHSMGKGEGDGTPAGIWDAEALYHHVMGRAEPREESLMQDTSLVTAPYPLAPWAEVVPHAPPMTVDDLECLPDDEGWRYELVDGVLIREPSSGYEASNVGYRLGSRLAVYVEDHALGGVTGEQGGYRLDPTHPRTTEFAPDVAFVRADRLPPRDSPAYRQALVLAPDLAVEVASPYQYQPGMDEKARRYLQFGTRLVWVIWPSQQRVDVWRPGDETPTALAAGDTLDGEDVVPGFRYPVANLFA